MLRKIYQELVEIRKELQAINKSLELSQKNTTYALVREPYDTAYRLIRAGRDGSLEAK